MEFDGSRGCGYDCVLVSVCVCVHVVNFKESLKRANRTNRITTYPWMVLIYAGTETWRMPTRIWRYQTVVLLSRAFAYFSISSSSSSSLRRILFESANTKFIHFDMCSLTFRIKHSIAAELLLPLPLYGAGGFFLTQNTAFVRLANVRSPYTRRITSIASIVFVLWNGCKHQFISISSRKRIDNDFFSRGTAEPIPPPLFLTDYYGAV